MLDSSGWQHLLQKLRLAVVLGTVAMRVVFSCILVHELH